MAFLPEVWHFGIFVTGQRKAIKKQKNRIFELKPWSKIILGPKNWQTWAKFGVYLGITIRTTARKSFFFFLRTQTLVFMTLSKY